MVKTAEFGVPCASVPQSGACRICGCTDAEAWADESKTLCNSSSCIAAAKREINRG